MIHFPRLLLLILMMLIMMIMMMMMMMMIKMMMTKAKNIRDMEMRFLFACWAFCTDHLAYFCWVLSTRSSRQQRRDLQRKAEKKSLHPVFYNACQRVRTWAQMVLRLILVCWRCIPKKNSAQIRESPEATVHTSTEANESKGHAIRRNPSLGFLLENDEKVASRLVAFERFWHRSREWRDLRLGLFLYGGKMSVRVAKILAKPWPKCYGKTKRISGKKQLPKSPEMRDEFKIRSIEPVVNS